MAERGMHIPAGVRSTAERMLRGRVVTRRLPPELGHRPIYVSPDSALSYLRSGARGFDKMLLTLATQLVHPDMVVWDIGANVGVFTFAAAFRAAGGKVVAVEPDPFLVSLLRRSCGLAANRDLNVEVLAAATSDCDGVTRLAIAERGRSSNTIAEAVVGSQRGGVREEITVPTLRLDTLLRHFPPPDLIKIDVEGAEALVLRGCEQVLEDSRPILVVEVHEANRDEITARLSAADYVLYDAEGDLARPIEACAWNTLARPREACAPPAGS